MTLTEAHEYIDRAHEAEGEQRAEFGMGAASMGWDPGEWSAAYDGYRPSEDPEYQAAQAVIEQARAVRVQQWRPVDPDDIPF